MRAARRSLEIRAGLIWVPVTLTESNGVVRTEPLILDPGTPNTILSLELAEVLGFPESAGAGVATYDTPDGPVLGYTARLPAMRALGREVRDYLLGVKVFHSRLHVRGILGLDFFSGTDLLLSFLSQSIHLAW